MIDIRAIALIAMMLVGGRSTSRLDAATDRSPSITVTAVDPDRLCSTHGTLDTVGSLVRIAEPTVRAFARGSQGDAAALAFRYVGPTQQVRRLASGQQRHQLGLKLRARDSCNVIYVIWRDDRPHLDVSIKINPWLRTHEQCGASGYTKLAAGFSPSVPVLVPGAVHTLRAEIVDDVLIAWVDDRVAWTGEVPLAARELTGPAGFRTDNVELEIHQFSAPAAPEPASRCAQDAGDD